MKYLPLLFCLATPSLQSMVIIRLAQTSDLPKLLKLDQTVTYDYFLPLVYNHYGHLLNYETLLERMEKELEDNKELFAQAIQKQNNYRLHVAIDNQTNRVNGYCFSQKKGTTLELILSMVYKEWEDTDLEIDLNKAAIAQFPDIRKCTAQPLQCNKKACQLYEKLGFINKGPGSPEILNVHGFGLDTWIFNYELVL